VAILPSLLKLSYRDHLLSSEMEERGRRKVLVRLLRFHFLALKHERYKDYHAGDPTEGYATEYNIKRLFHGIYFLFDRLICAYR